MQHGSTALSVAAGAQARPAVGFRVSHSAPAVDHASIAWTHDERALFDQDASAYVIQDLHRLSDAALTLLAGRPTLFMLASQRDATHLALLLFERLVVLTPHDAVLSRLDTPVPPGCRPHQVVDASDWLSAHHSGSLSGAVAPFGALSKAQLIGAAARGQTPPIANVQHFWRAVGSTDARLAQIMMPTGRMLETANGGLFDRFAPTILFVDGQNLAALSALKLEQSAALVAPIALPRGASADALAATFAEARDAPFQLHTINVIADRADHTLGCLYGEYVA